MLNAKKLVNFFSNNKEIILAASSTILGSLGVASIRKLSNYFSTEKNEDVSAELQRKIEENNHQILLWTYSAVAIEFLINFSF